MRSWLVSTEVETLESYKGIVIHARTGLHQQLIDLVQQHIPAGSSVIDVGAGAGAFSQRLKDQGYAVAAVDVDPSEWARADIPFLQLDINQGIAKSIDRVFDAACCIEVIEHVENPWELLRDIRAIVRPGGILILSTPNVTSFLSRLIFFRKARLHQFFESDLEYGHINPVSFTEVRNIAANTGWQVLQTMPAGYLPVFDFSERGVRSLAFNLLRGVFYLLTGEQKKGWNLIFVLKNHAA